MNADWAGPLLLGVMGVALLVSVVTDVASRRVLDAVTYPACLACLGLRFWMGGVGAVDSQSGTGLVSGLVGAAALAGLFAVFAWRKSMGWGDVKLTAVVGAGLGYPQILAAAAFISLAGALQAVVLLLWTGNFQRTVSKMVRRVVHRRERPSAEGVPYAVAIALGTVWTFWWESSNLR